MTRHKYQKGETILMETKNGLTVCGLVYEYSQTQITIAHNFNGLEPIDKTIVNLEDVEISQIIEPKELTSLK